MKKTIGRVQFKTDYEFVEEGDTFISTVTYVEGSSEAIMACGSEAFMIVREVGWKESFHLHELDGETRRAAQRIATISSLAYAPTSAAVSYSGKMLSLRNNAFFGWFGVQLLFQKLNLSIIEGGNEMGSVERSGRDYIFKFGGAAPKEIQTFLFWGLLYGLYRPRD